jgi:hypothetical protein
MIQKTVMVVTAITVSIPEGSNEDLFLDKFRQQAKPAEVEDIPDMEVHDTEIVDVYDGGSHEYTK